MIKNFWELVRKQRKIVKMSPFSNRGNKSSEKKWFVSTWNAIFGPGMDLHGGSRKYEHYLFVISILAIFLSALAILNAYFHFINISSYDIIQEGQSPSFLLAGYLGMFIGIAFLPIPDYFLIPAYGYLSSIGIFNPYTSFLVCLVAAVLPMEYAPGRLVGRPLLLKGLSFFHIYEKDIEAADKWLAEHGRFSVLISTFIPFFYSITSLAAGTLKMNVIEFLLASAAGFGVRYVFLEYIGYHSVYIFTTSFDYSHILLFCLAIILSSLYAAFYIIRTLQSDGRRVTPS
jgi:membrane protein DedA with SNARE-associated domain